MRLHKVHTGHRLRDKAMLGVMRVVMGHAPGVVRTLLYRKEFFGRQFSELTHQLMREVSRWPEVVALGAAQRAPHLVVNYLRELAQAFHAFYAALPFIVDDARTRNARLALIAAAQQVLRNALTLLGVSAPETM